MSLALQAGLWGLLSGSALLIGAAIGWRFTPAQRMVAAIMAFGCGVLISALAFDLMDQAFRRAGLSPALLGFLGGAAAFAVLNHIVGKAGAKHRKRARGPAGGVAAAVLGALLDGIPEAMVIGVSLLEGAGVSGVALAAVFLSNVPEGLSSTAGMKVSGRSAGYVAALWSGIALAMGAAAAFGYAAFAGAPPASIALVQTFAAGAILAMVVDTMVPEAFEGTHDFAGLIAALGFLLAFALSKAAA